MSEFDQFIQNGMAAPAQPAQTQQPGWNQASTSQQLQQLIAPYQQAVQRIQNPYQTMSQNSWLAQNHPGIAGVVDNAFNTVADMGQGGMSIGSNIQAVMQGLKGNQMDRRNQMMQSAMLPYQMAEPQIKMQDELAQIGQRQEAQQYQQRREIQLDNQNQLWQSEMLKNQRDSSKPIGSGMVDDQGHAWQSVFDPVSGKVTQQPLEPVPSGYQPSFAQHLGSQKAAQLNENYTPSGILRRMAEGDPSAKKDWANFQGMQGGLAGQKSGSEQASKQPQLDIDSEVQMAQKEFAPIPTNSQKEWEDNNMQTPGFDFANSGKLYQQYQADTNAKNQANKEAHDAMISDYRQTAEGMKAKGITVPSWAQYHAMKGPTSGGPASSAPAHKVGDTIQLKNNKTVKITAMHPDGSFDAQ